MRIALVSEHASPLAVLGGVDAGGQNVHVAALARALGRRGHEVVRLHAAGRRRRSPSGLPLAPGVTSMHVARRARRGRCQGRAAAASCGSSAAGWRRTGGPRVRPTSSTPTSGCPAWPRSRPPRAVGVPVAQTFHALGDGQAAPPGCGRHQPGRPDRPRAPARLAGRPDHRDLLRRGGRARRHGRSGAPGRASSRAASTRRCSTPARW